MENSLETCVVHVAIANLPQHAIPWKIDFSGV